MVRRRRAPLRRHRCQEKAPIGCRKQQAKHRWPQDDPADQLTQHCRLPKATHELAKDQRHREHHGELKQGKGLRPSASPRSVESRRPVDHRSVTANCSRAHDPLTHSIGFKGGLGAAEQRVRGSNQKRHRTKLESSHEHARSHSECHENTRLRRHGQPLADKGRSCTPLRIPLAALIRPGLI